MPNNIEPRKIIIGGIEVIASTAAPLDKIIAVGPDGELQAIADIKTGRIVTREEAERA